MALSDKFGMYGQAAEAARNASVVGGVSSAVQGAASLIGDVARKNALKKKIRGGERKAKQGGDPNDIANLTTGLQSTLRSPMTENMPGSAGVGYSGRTAGDKLREIESGQEKTLAAAGQLVGQQRRAEMEALQGEREIDQAQIRKINQEMLKRALTTFGGAASAYTAAQQSPEAEERREKRQEIRAEEFAKGRLPKQVRARKRWAKNNPSRVLPEATGEEIVDAVEGVDYATIQEGLGVKQLGEKYNFTLDEMYEANPHLKAQVESGERQVDRWGGPIIDKGEQLKLPKKEA